MLDRFCFFCLEKAGDGSRSIFVLQLYESHGKK